MPMPTPRASNVIPAAPAPVLVGARLVPGNQIEMTWTTAAGRSYQVRFKNKLDDPEWMLLDNPVLATGDQLVVTAEMSLSAQKLLSPGAFELTYLFVSFTAMSS